MLPLAVAVRPVGALGHGGAGRVFGGGVGGAGGGAGAGRVDRRDPVVAGGGGGKAGVGVGGGVDGRVLATRVGPARPTFRCWVETSIL